MHEFETSGRDRRPSGAAQTDVRRANRRFILQMLRDSGSMSRASLAREVGLTPPAVSAVVKELIADGLVEDVGRSSGGVGKPARLLALDPDAVHIVALDVSQPSIVVGGVVDLVGKIAHRGHRSIAGMTGRESQHAVMELAQALVHEAQRPVLGIGIGVPGVVSDHGTVVNGAHLEWVDVDLGAQIGAATSKPVVIANDANAAAFGEVSFGRSDSSNLLLIKVDNGVGAGLVINHQLFSGDGFAAGEFGHIVIDPLGSVCVCGKRGCLETVVSDPLLAPALSSAGPAEIADTLVEAGTRLGEVLSLIVGALNINDVVVSGSDHVVGEPFRNAVKTAIARRSMAETSGNVQIRPSVFGSDDVLMGAAALVLNQQLGLI